MLNPAATTSLTITGNTPTPQPMGLSVLLDTTFSLYRENFLLLTGILILHFLGILVEYTLESFLPDIRFKTLVTSIASAPFVLVSIGGIIVATATIYLNRDITSSDALKQTFRRFVPLLVCHILWILAWGIPFIFAAFALRQGINATITVLLVLMPFGIYFTVRWVFLAEVVLLEKPIVQYALKRSGELVGSTWWRVCGISTLILLLSVAIHFIFEISFGLILHYTNLAGEIAATDIIKWSIMQEPPHSSSPLFYTLMTCINLLLRTFTVPVWVIGIALLYFDLRIRKEGFDIETQMDEDITVASPHN